MHLSSLSTFSKHYRLPVLKRIYIHTHTYTQVRDKLRRQQEKKKMAICLYLYNEERRTGAETDRFRYLCMSNKKDEMKKMINPYISL